LFAQLLKAEEIRALLGLHPHQTCGYTNEIYRSSLVIPKDVLPSVYDGPRTLGGFLYFLVTREAPVRLHRIRSDQMYHYYSGQPLEVLLIGADGTCSTSIIGPALEQGMRPQLLVPSNTFHAARVLGDGDYSLMGTTVWLRAEPSDVEMGNAEALAAAYPAVREPLATFMRGE
jgi:uncharacterized protein